MKFTIDLDKIKKVTLIIFISLLVSYITIKSIMLVIDCNKRNQLKVEEIEKTYT